MNCLLTLDDIYGDGDDAALEKWLRDLESQSSSLMAITEINDCQLEADFAEQLKTVESQASLMCLAGAQQVDIDLSRATPKQVYRSILFSKAPLTVMGSCATPSPRSAITSNLKWGEEGSERVLPPLTFEPTGGERKLMSPISILPFTVERHLVTISNIAPTAMALAKRAMAKADSSTLLILLACMRFAPKAASIVKDAFRAITMQAVTISAGMHERFLTTVCAVVLELQRRLAIATSSLLRVGVNT